LGLSGEDRDLDGAAILFLELQVYYSEYLVSFS
jgi:hypothetical protein